MPEYFTGKIFSLDDVINYLITGKLPASYNGEKAIPEKLIKETKAKLNVLKEEFAPLFQNYKEDASDPDWIWADWKMKGLNEERHELIFNLMMDHHIAVPGFDGWFGEGPFESVSHCENTIIQELYSNWI